MGATKIRLFGSLTFERWDGSTKLRTIQQGLLLAHLSLASAPVDRGDLAVLLWPDAERENALAYLRRAIMELRATGVEIETPAHRIMVVPGSLTSDLDELLDSVHGAFTLLPQIQVLEAVDHPAAEGLRGDVLERIAARQRRHSAPRPETKKARDFLTWIGEKLVQERPEVVAELIAENGLTLTSEFPSAPLLDVYLQVLNGDLPLTKERLSLKWLAAGSAHVLTRYPLAERLYREAIDDAERYGRSDLASPSLSSLAFLQMELRRWPEARITADRCLLEAKRSGDPEVVGLAYTNLAGIQWHQLDFTNAVKNYRRAIETAPDPNRVVPIANLAYLWGVFGAPAIDDFGEEYLSKFPNEYRGVPDAYLQFSRGMGSHDALGAALGAARLIEITLANGMERLFCVAIDCTAMALARLGRPERAASCVRLGSRLRFEIGHRRSPGEKLAIRRNVPGPYFGPSIESGELRSDDFERLEKSLLHFLGPL